MFDAPTPYIATWSTVLDPGQQSLLGGVVCPGGAAARGEWRKSFISGGFHIVGPGVQMSQTAAFRIWREDDVFGEFRLKNLGRGDCVQVSVLLQHSPVHGFAVPWTSLEGIEVDNSFFAPDIHFSHIQSTDVNGAVPIPEPLEPSGSDEILPSSRR